MISVSELRELELSWSAICNYGGKFEFPVIIAVHWLILVCQFQSITHMLFTIDHNNAQYFQCKTSRKESLFDNLMTQSFKLRIPNSKISVDEQPQHENQFLISCFLTNHLHFMVTSYSGLVSLLALAQNYRSMIFSHPCARNCWIIRNKAVLTPFVLASRSKPGIYVYNIPKLLCIAYNIQAWMLQQS